MIKVLIVEDEGTSQAVLAKIIEPFAKWEIVENGEQGFATWVNAHEANQKFDLILLDIELPHADGKEVLGEIRAYEEERGIVGKDGVKVIMTTAVNDMYSVLEAQSKGCSAYLSKPIERKKLLKEMRRLGLISDTAK